MKDSTFVDLDNPQPGGYYAGDLYLEDGQLIRKLTRRSKFIGDLFVVDRAGKVWLGIRRSVYPVKGAPGHWFAVKIEQGRKRNWRPAPFYWREFVCSSQVIPLWPQPALRNKRR